MEFQEGMEPNLEAKGDTHTIGSLLKLYLRSLPDSVIPSSLYEDFVAIILTYELNQVSLCRCMLFCIRFYNLYIKISKLLVIFPVDSCSLNESEVSKLR